MSYFVQVIISMSVADASFNHNPASLFWAFREDKFQNEAYFFISAPGAIIIVYKGKKVNRNIICINLCSNVLIITMTITS